MTENRTEAALILLHRRRRNLSRGAFHDDWGTLRARAVTSRQHLLGHLAYHQVHQVAPWNPTFLALRLSRSWPVVAVSSLLRGLAPTAPRLARDRWHLAELLTFADLATLRAALATQRATDALAGLAADAGRVTSATTAVACETHVATAGIRDSGAATLYAFRARPRTSADKLAETWLRRHGPWVAGLQPTLGFAAYDQHLGMPMPVPGTPTAHAPLDGIAALTYPSLRAIERGLFSPRIVATNLRLVHDEVGFIDAPRSALLMGDVRNAWTDEAVSAERARPVAE